MSSIKQNLSIIDIKKLIISIMSDNGVNNGGVGNQFIINSCSPNIDNVSSGRGMAECTKEKYTGFSVEAIMQTNRFGPKLSAGWHLEFTLSDADIKSMIKYYYEAKGIKVTNIKTIAGIESVNYGTIEMNEYKFSGYQVTIENYII